MRLVTYAEPYCEGLADCDSMTCKQKLVCVARLFMKVRLFHAIKTSNIDNKCAHGKRSRKMLKLLLL